MDHMCVAEIELRSRQNQQTEMSLNYVSGMKAPQSISEEVALEVTTRHGEEHTQGSVPEGVCVCMYERGEAKGKTNKGIRSIKLV